MNDIMYGTICGGGCGRRVMAKIGKGVQLCDTCLAMKVGSDKAKDVFDAVSLGLSQNSEARASREDAKNRVARKILDCVATAGIGVDPAKPGGDRTVFFQARPNPDTDPGAHYRREIRKRITDEDIARGFVVVKVDPYRICKLVGIAGGPHEHTTKKLLRGEAKGHDARELIAEVRCCLDRWEEMLNEDEEEALCR